MPIIRQPKKFTMIPYELIDNEDLSVGAMFLLIYVLSKPKDWVFTESEARLRMDCGRQKIQRMLTELRAEGYLKYEKVRQKNGMMKGCNRIFSSRPEFK